MDHVECLPMSTRIVLHILPWPGVGGTEAATLRIAEAAAQAGFTSVMACCVRATEVAAFFRDRGFDVVHFDTHDFLRHGKRGWLRGTADLVRCIGRSRASIVHCADLRAAEFAAVACTVKRRPMIVHIRNRYEWLTRQQRFVLLFASRIVFVSRHTGDHFGEASSLSSRFRRIGQVLYDGYEAPTASSAADRDEARASVRAEFGLAPDARVVGMVARIALQKDHGTLIRAAEQVIDAVPNACFLAVGPCGPGPIDLAHGEALGRKVAQSRVADRFLFTGARSDVPRLLDAFDVFVLSTHYEGLPLSILEAMGHRCPVVATRVDGVPEIVRHDETGLLHEHEDADELAQRLVALLRDPSYAERLASKAAALVVEEFSVPRFRERVVVLYRDVLRKPRSLPA